MLQTKIQFWRRLAPKGLAATICLVVFLEGFVSVHSQYLERFQEWVRVLAAAKKDGLADIVLPTMQYRRTAQRLFTTFSTEEKEAWLNRPRGPYPSDNEIRRLIELCQRASIKSVLVTNPIPAVSVTPENRQGLAALEAQLRQLAPESGPVAFYAPFARFYPVELCQSYNHLTEAGAQRNSAEVSRALIDLLHLNPAPSAAMAAEKLPLPADSTASFRNGLAGKIVFQSDRSGNWDIYAMNADGSNLVQLTDDPGADEYPVWSPDGSQIAFYSDRDGNCNIYLMNADGSNQRRLTDHPAHDRSPAWSPDGKRLAFDSERDNDLEIYLINADGSGLAQWTDSIGKNILPDWSPDGNRIVYTGNRYLGWNVYAMNLDHADDRRLTGGHGACRPDWSPDGRKIAYVSQEADGKGDIWIMNPDGSEQTRVTTDDQNYDYYPAWSPDGKSIAYAKTPDKNTGNWELHVISADGTTDVPLTDHPARDAFPDWANGSIPADLVRPPRFVYEAESAPRQIGRPQADPEAFGGQAAYAAKAEKAGFLMYGPYKAYAPGGYVAHFRLKTDQTALTETIAAIDVAAAAGVTVVAKKELTGKDFPKNNAYQEWQLAFTLRETKTLEFRVYAFGKANLWVDHVTVTLNKP